jgi:hypothetical protein
MRTNSRRAQGRPARRPQPDFRSARVPADLNRNRNRNLFGRAHFRTVPGYLRDIPVEFPAAPAEIRTTPGEFRANPGCSGLIRSGPAYKYRGGMGPEITLHP